MVITDYYFKILFLFFFIILRGYVLRSSSQQNLELGLTYMKPEEEEYPAETIADNWFYRRSICWHGLVSTASIKSIPLDQSQK
jgi:hypothetical protein